MLVPDQEGHVTKSDLLMRAYDIFKPKDSKVPTYINYNKIHCGTCNKIMHHVKDIGSGHNIIYSTLRYCVKCKILINFAKLEVLRIRFS